MPIAEARVHTDRSSRYLVQLCRHAGKMGRHGRVDVQWSDTRGTLTIDGDTCTLLALPDALLLRAEAADEPGLARIQELITANLRRFSTRDPLTVRWHRGDTPAEAAPTPTRRHRRHWTVPLVVLAVLAVAAHVLLGSAALAAPAWAGWLADAVLVLLLLKAALVGLGYLTHRLRTRATR